MAAITHLRALQALELALRHGSMKAAASELAISPAAVGQRIRSLEDYLGYDLLVRGRSGIRATAELEQAIAHLGAAFRELETVSGILDFQRVNEIHVTADADWAELWLKPRLDAFRVDNPGTMFCINGLGDVPMRLGDADVEIVLTEQVDGEADPLFRDYLAPVSSPANTRRISELPNEARLEGFPLLHLDCYTVERDDMGWEAWTSRFGRRSTAPERGMRYKRVQHALEAVYANAGLMICGLSLIRPELDADRLSLPFPIGEGAWSDSTYVAVFRPAALRRVPIARFRDWLLEEGRAEAEGLDALVVDRA